MKTIKNMPVAVESALHAVVKARTEWKRVNGIDHATKLEVLNSHAFHEEESGKHITDTADDFLMSDADFRKYATLVYERNCEKGIDSGGPDLNFYPLHKAVYNAEDALIDAITADIPDYTPDIVHIVKTNATQRAEFLNVAGL